MPGWNFSKRANTLPAFTCYDCLSAAVAAAAAFSRAFCAIARLSAEALSSSTTTSAPAAFLVFSLSFMSHCFVPGSRFTR
ncbi:hypothetical protein Y032_0004g2222 [Ancylostoma ceylanicum]|uniref:Uncharacterized protein n=1 Tax=Ancylostoma ceylanicum TaxID=53326 RepID=A0A016VX61_9BILA|nr:hypothetical protein Y032_0004g2222 [Ancylostoma ceylanicum]